MKRFLKADIYWLLLFFAITLFVLYPATQKVFVRWTGEHPYLMGFIKFAVLASMGELLAIRLNIHAWKTPPGFLYRVLVWGVLGIFITFMFSFYSQGTAAVIEKGLLPAGSGFWGALLSAFYTSALMNLTFGPVFMAAHRVSDTYIEFFAKGAKPGLAEVIEAIRWADFVHFVIFKTIPLWWIPAHTLTFLLPGEYRVLAAAYLSIVLGIILAYARSRKSV